MDLTWILALVADILTRNLAHDGYEEGPNHVYKNGEGHGFHWYAKATSSNGKATRYRFHFIEIKRHEESAVPLQ